MRILVALVGSIGLACVACASPMTPTASPTTPEATPVPSPYLLELANVDGPPVDVLIDATPVAHLDCAQYGQLVAGVGGVPQLPWTITVRRTNGAVLFGPQSFVGGGDRVRLYLRGTHVFISGGPSGPTSEPCSRWDAASPAA
jgi:hypothetical protein